jgi:hypothetical protein
MGAPPKRAITEAQLFRLAAPPRLDPPQGRREVVWQVASTITKAMAGQLKTIYTQTANTRRQLSARPRNLRGGACYRANLIRAVK